MDLYRFVGQRAHITGEIEVCWSNEIKLNISIKLNADSDSVKNKESGDNQTQESPNQEDKEVNNCKPLVVPLTNSEAEDGFFHHILELRRQNPGGGDFHLYMLSVSGCNTSYRSVIIREANRWRIYPLSLGYNHSFNIYFYSMDSAKEFLYFVHEYGGNALLREM